MSDKRTAAKCFVEKLVPCFEQNIHQLKAPFFSEAQALAANVDTSLAARAQELKVISTFQDVRNHHLLM